MLINNENVETRSDAGLLFNRIHDFKLLSLLKYWSTVLSRFDRVQKRLENPSLTFCKAADDIRVLHQQI